MSDRRAARDHFPLLVIAGIALLGYLAAQVIRAADRGNFADALSTYRSDDKGARGLFLFAQESGLDARRHQRDLEVIEPKAQLVLLAVDGAQDLESLFDEDDDASSDKPDAGLRSVGNPVAVFWPSADGGVAAPDAGVAEVPRDGLNSLFVVSVGKDERKQLLEHVAAGETLLYAPARAGGDPLLDELGVHLRPARPGPIRLSPALPSPFTADVGEVTAPVRAFQELPKDALPLLDDDDGEVVFSVVTHGAGRVLVLTAPELASNEWLGKADNAQLWLSALKVMAHRGPLWFDEYHHGFTSERSVAELASRYGLHFAIGQLLLGLCLWAGALRRFGRARTPAQDERGTADALSAISRIYREGKHRSHAAQQILRGLLQDLAPLAGRRPQEGPRAVAAALAARGRKDLASALGEVADLASGATTERDVENIARTAALARRRIQT